MTIAKINVLKHLNTTFQNLFSQMFLKNEYLIILYKFYYNQKRLEVI